MDSSRNDRERQTEAEIQRNHYRIALWPLPLVQFIAVSVLKDENFGSIQAEFEAAVDRAVELDTPPVQHLCELLTGEPDPYDTGVGMAWAQLQYEEEFDQDTYDNSEGVADSNY